MSSHQIEMFETPVKAKRLPSPFVRGQDFPHDLAEYCPQCQSTMSIEEIDWGKCDCCGYPEEDADWINDD